MNLTFQKSMRENNGFPLAGEREPNFRIESRDEDGVLRLFLTGTWTGKNDASLELEMSELIKQHSAKRVLVDICDLKGRLGVVDCYVHVQRLPPECRARKTAFIDVPENLEDDSFLQTIAQNRGFPIKYFINKADAILWLNE